MKTAKNHLEIGKLMKYHRQAQSLSQAELAKKAGLTQPAVSNIEHGLGGSLRAVEALMQALNLEIEFHPRQSIDKSNLVSLID